MQDMLVLLLFFLDTNSIENKAFEGLTIWVKQSLNLVVDRGKKL